MKTIIFTLAALIPLAAIAQPVLDDAYYNKLRQACRNNSSSMLNDDSCCQASVDAMQDRKAFRMEPSSDTVCPAGYSKNMLRCVSTFQWCEPNESQAPATEAPKTEAPKPEEKK